ncbi:pilus assembly protein PilP [Vibrio tubiashii]|uniref:pilus assembly protein PilP n=1 Tax=Vibrio tubiashii TaxID=29498 RepID=UPI001EFC6A9D|nr:pilus assembly protein PilP [Vibrio tubiashii]MCG9584318.1 pilus assembly protein PilP [Vibrio tubiashii]MCG9618345.1 pilus assembly protein PilP [Vibrio tubiashii]MCG9685714.1 pilus assembly protein PilP [Vibrio tubiashii]
MKINRLLPLIALVSGCKANQAPLEEYLAQLKRDAEVGGYELAPLIDVQSPKYTAHQVRQPFELPQAALSINQQALTKDCWQPKRNTSQLATFPLSQLQLKGVMSRGGRNSALIEAPTGRLVQVNSGSNLGLNHGKVTKVADDYLFVQEAIADGLGCWQLRETKLALK